MVTISFSVKDFDTKVLNGSKTRTTRVLETEKKGEKISKYKRFYTVYKNRHHLHLYWKNRTKESRLLGETTTKSLCFIKITKMKANNYSSLNQALNFTIKVKDYIYSFYTGEIDSLGNQDYLINGKGEIKDWKLRNDEWLRNYIKEEGFSSLKDLEFLYEFLVTKQNGNLFWSLEWNYPFDFEEKEKQKKLVKRKPKKHKKKRKTKIKAKQLQIFF